MNVGRAKEQCQGGREPWEIGGGMGHTQKLKEVEQGELVKDRKRTRRGKKEREVKEKEQRIMKQNDNGKRGAVKMRMGEGEGMQLEEKKENGKMFNCRRQASMREMKCNTDNALLQYSVLESNCCCHSPLTIVVMDLLIRGRVPILSKWTVPESCL